jgi:hypothetical protein
LLAISHWAAELSGNILAEFEDMNSRQRDRLDDWVHRHVLRR